VKLLPAWLGLALAALIHQTTCLAQAPAARPPKVQALTDDAFLEVVERAAFDYFWKEANPTNGLVRDRSRPDSKCSIAAVGFGLSSINIAIERGWISRNAGRDRVLSTLRTFAGGTQGDAPAGVIGTHGWFYHFLDLNTGQRAWKCELSSIDTALLLAGALDASEFFSGTTPEEREIRSLSDGLFARVDWTWMLNGGEAFSMGWHPEKGFIPRRWVGYNEGMLLYVLALGAARDPVPPSAWAAWTRGYQWRTNYGQSFIAFAPLFGHQYTHCWIDFRGIVDPFTRRHGIDYFENSRRATLAQQAYAIENPRRFPGYGPLVWGFTACDGPGSGGFQGYAARGVPPPELEDGTIAPTAVGGSLPFAPEICLPTLRNLSERFGSRLWTAYGFRDAFNLKADWWAPDVLGIDQGVILLMIENHRTGAVWQRMMRNPIIRRGLERAGFEPLSKPR
jgi:hypothetical protein